MSDILIKNVPAPVHKKLKEIATQHRRSMTKEALALLEEALSGHSERSWPEPIKGKFPITPGWLKKTIREGRA
jgi:plasmid stability protein